jgi:alanine or glycine:cation symporter, AGCS family
VRSARQSHFPFIILVSGPGIYDPAHPGAIAGASLTQSAIAASLGSWTTGLVSIVVFIFGFSAVLGDYVCAEANLFFMGARRQAITVLKIVTLIAVACGALSKLAVVWALADVGMALVAIVNLVAICLLGEWAFAALKDFHRQSEEGKHPVFAAGEADLPGVLDGDVRRLPEPGPVGSDVLTRPSPAVVT